MVTGYRGDPDEIRVAQRAGSTRRTPVTMPSTSAPAMMPVVRVECNERQRPERVADCGQAHQAVGEPLESMVQRRNAVDEYASAHKEHGRCPGHGQPPHQPGCARKNSAAQAALQPGKRRFAAALAEVHARRRRA